ncbi:putative pentatricopeptide repeat-containing protein At1g64310 [Andrographis paniculata]|uniref:putative pentatricopeptide repeat-containing protein At1g64310 n=1 Tax=Andrographis paniculata TaxID=175694 RepID=UPI0021E78FDA|nr:putative pentatricopeptide repeat-containing protein At1g64310 [Andrographis paniculata]
MVGVTKVKNCIEFFSQGHHPRIHGVDLMKKQLLTHLTKPNQTLAATRILHALVLNHGLFIDPFYPTKILRFYAINGDLVSARNLFDESPHRTIYLWNALIRAYARARNFHHAFLMFNALLTSESQPDSRTFACVARACGERLDVESLQIVHGEVTAFGLESDFVCGSALVTSYSKVGRVDEARRIFDRINSPDLALSNAMISGHGSVGESGKAMELFNSMRRVGIEPDGYTAVGLISGLAHASLTAWLGEMIHGLCEKHGLASNDHVGSALVKMYSTMKNMESAFRVFDSIVRPDLVTWSALITGFCRTGDHVDALVFFRDLVANRGRVDCVLLASVLAVCGHLASVRPGSEIHGYVIRCGYSTEVSVSSSLVDMYSKCGFIEAGIRVFNETTVRNIVTYNTAIMNLGLYGRASEAFRMFEKVLEAGLKPDESTFVGLLCACCHSGLANEGREYFRKMRSEYNIEGKTEHYVYMVKLVGMFGKLEEAFELIKSFPEPVDSGVWGTLLSCCEFRKDYAMAEVIAEHLLGNQSRMRIDCRYRVMVSNILAGEGRWDEAKALRGAGAEGKVPGISWIPATTGNRFVAG